MTRATERDGMPETSRPIAHRRERDSDPIAYAMHSEARSQSWFARRGDWVTPAVMRAAAVFQMVYPWDRSPPHSRIERLNGADDKCGMERSYGESRKADADADLSADVGCAGLPVRAQRLGGEHDSGSRPKNLHFGYAGLAPR